MGLTEPIAIKFSPGKKGNLKFSFFMDLTQSGPAHDKTFQTIIKSLTTFSYVHPGYTIISELNDNFLNPKGGSDPDIHLVFCL